MKKSVILACALSVSFGLVSSNHAQAANTKAPVRRAGPARPAAAQGGASQAVYQAYLNGLRVKVLNNWDPASGKNHVVLTTNVMADGSTQELNAVSTPKNTPAEQAASDAFAKSLPFNALPAGIDAPAKLTLTFDSTYDPHGDSRTNLSTNLQSAPKAPVAKAGAPAAAAPTQDAAAPAQSAPAQSAAPTQEVPAQSTPTQSAPTQ